MISDAAAWDDARVRELHRGAEPHERAGRERVDRDDRVGLHRAHRAAQRLHRLNARPAQNARCQHADRAKCGKRAVLPQMARYKHMLRTPRPDGVRRHIRVAESRDEHAFHILAEQRPEFRPHGARRAFEHIVCVFLQRREVERHIPSAGLAELARRALGVDAHARHAAPAAKNRPAVHAGERLRAAFRAEQLVRLHGKIGAVLEHFASLLLLNLVFLSYFIHKVLCHTKKSENFEKMLAISCILC